MEEKSQSLVGEAIIKSLFTLEGLKESSSILLNSLDEEIEAAEDFFRQMMESFKTKVEVTDLDEENKAKVIFNIPPANLIYLRKYSHKLQHLNHAKTIVPRNFLISYVSEFDYFLGSLIRNIYQLRPDLINKNIQYTLEDILSFASIEELKIETVEKEIESLLRSSHTEQFKTLESKIKTDLRKIDIWPDFIELTERRNLFVHADGIVSSQYIKVCKTAGLTFPEEDIGKKLHADLAYLNQAFYVMYEIILKLGFTLWRIYFEKDEREFAHSDSYLIHVVFELLCKEEYKLAIKIGEFLVKQHRHSNDKRKRMLAINLCLAYKYSGEIEKCNRVLDSYDWSSVQTLFQLAISCINDEHARSCELIEKLVNDQELNEIALHEWPLFKVLRNENIFKETYLNIFQSDFNAVTIIDRSEVSDQS